MQPFIAEKREEIAALCRQHHVRRLSVFGSAARDDFDPATSDIDVLFGDDGERAGGFGGWGIAAGKGKNGRALRAREAGSSLRSE